MIAAKPVLGSTQNCSRRLQDDILWRRWPVAGSFVIPLLSQRKANGWACAAVRRMHGRHAAILLDFYCDPSIFSRSTRVLPLVLRLAVLAALTVEF
jgi:hypothetical protein